MIKTATGYEYTPTKKDYIKIYGSIVLGFIFCFCSVGAVLSAIQPAQLIYDNAVLDYNEKVLELKEAKDFMIQSEKELAIEKLEDFTEKENWKEVERLTKKLQLFQ